MTFNRSSQLVLVSAASLLVGGLLTACGTLTTDFVFVTSSKAAGPNSYGEVDVFEINADSGKMRTIPASPFPSGGRNPVAEVPSPDNTNLYIVNRDDNTIVQFVIGTDGKLYPQATVNTPGIFPISVSVAGKFLVVADTYQPLPVCSPAAPCSGSVAVFPIGAGNALGTPATNSSASAQYWPIALASAPSHVIMPTAVASAASGAFVYVTAYDTSVSPSVGYVFGFAVNGDGTLTALNGGVPFAAGVQPSAIASSPDGGTIYVTDTTSNTLLVYSASGGLLTPIAGSPFATGNAPSAVVVDATGSFVYVANSVDSSLTGYSTSGGTVNAIGTYSTGTQPLAIGIDPSLNQYLYTANFLGNTVSGFQISATSGTLLNSQFSPYPSNANPTAVAAIPHKVSR
ncbi:MAG: beta-propeller fold lactonase family protein [Terracidiphilus sp.]